MMNDSDGLLMTAAMLMAVAIDGDDEDVKMAARGNYIPLAHKYGDKAEPMFQLLKGVRDQMRKEEFQDEPIQAKDSGDPESNRESALSL